LIPGHVFRLECASRQVSVLKPITVGYLLACR